MYSIRKMRALVSDHRQGKEVPGWVRFVLESQPAHADDAPAQRAPEASGERSRRMKQTLLGLQAPIAERWPATGLQGRKQTIPVAGLPAEDEEPAAQLERAEAGKRTISGMQAPPGESRLIALEPPAIAAEEAPAGKHTVHGMQAPDGKEGLILKLRDPQNNAERIAAAIGLAGMVSEIDDRELLVDIAISCNHKYLSHHVVEKLGGDAEALFRIAGSTILDEAAAHAFGKLCRLLPSIDSPEILTFIAERSDIVREKAEAAGRLAASMDSLSVQQLKAVAVSAPDEASRRKAVERIAGMVDSVGDVAALKIVAVYSEDEMARTEAVARLWKCPQALKTVATCSLHRDTKMAALEMLEGREDLMEVALNSIDDDAAVAAVRRLSGSERDLVSIYVTAERKTARDAAAACLCDAAGSLSSVEGLKIVVLNGEARERRVAMELLSAMVEGIDDRHALIYVGIWGTSWKQRRHALNALSDDEEALSLITETTDYEDSKRMARRLLGKDSGDASGAS